MSKQKQRVMGYIEKYGSITRAQAMSELGIANLTAVIADLRNKDLIPIERVDVETMNRYGEHCTYAVYRLPKECGDVQMQ